MRKSQTIPPDLEDTEDEILQFIANNYGEYIDNEPTAHEDGRDGPAEAPVGTNGEE